MDEPLGSSESGEITQPGATLGPAMTRAQERAIAVLEVLLCSSLPTQILIGGLLTSFGLSPQTSGNQLSLQFVLTLSLGDTAVLVGLMVFLCRLHGDSAWVLWRGDGPLTRELAWGLALVPAAVLVAGVLLTAMLRYLPELHNVPTNPLESLAKGGAYNAMVFTLVAVVAGGVREELQRAFLLQRFERHLGGAWTGVAVTSAGFGLGHAMQGWDAAVATGVLGAFWAMVYLRRRSSVAPIVSHAGFNSLQIFMALSQVA